MAEPTPIPEPVPLAEDAPAALEAMILAGDAAGSRALLDALPNRETVRALARLEDEHREQLLTLLEPEDAADVLEQLPEPHAVEAIEHMLPEAAARILEEVPSAQRADYLGQLDAEDAARILDAFRPDEAAEMRRLAAYEPDVAGGLMITEYVRFPVSARVRDVVDDLAANRDRYADYDIQYAYVVEDDERLVGVLRMRDLLLAEPSTPIRRIMKPGPLTVVDEAPLAELVATFEAVPYFGIPAVDAVGRLVGVVRRAAVEEAVAERSEQDYRSAQGIVGGEELRSMPLTLRCRRRLSWLSINIVLNIIAASVIALHQETLEAVIALAVFLPIISDMSGCSGNQAVAVSVRELTMGVTDPRDALRVLRQEVSVGLINGLVLGLLIGVVAAIWQANPWLGLVVGGALMLNTLIAVAIGGCIPLLLKRMRMDPALASGPILTTVTDMCGFLLVLSMAAALLQRLAETT